jgi:hypothetical protein
MFAGGAETGSAIAVGAAAMATATAPAAKTGVMCFVPIHMVTLLFWTDMPVLFTELRPCEPMSSELTPINHLLLAGSCEQPL